MTSNNMSKSMSNYLKVRHDVKLYIKYIMVSKCSSWRDVKRLPKKCVMTSKTRHDVRKCVITFKTRHDVKNTLLRQKHVMMSKSLSWRQKVCHDIKKCVKTRHDVKTRHHGVKKYIMMSKTRHDVEKSVMTSKSPS